MPLKSLTLEVLREKPLIVRVGSGKKAAAYIVRDLPSDFGRAFRVSRLDEAGKEIEDRSYYTLLDGGDSTCDCKGWCARGHCRHIRLCWELYKAGAPGQVKVKCTIARRTQKALQVELESGELVWLPLSQVKLEADGVVVPEWLGKEKGLL